MGYDPNKQQKEHQKKQTSTPTHGSRQPQQPGRTTSQKDTFKK